MDDILLRGKQLTVTMVIIEQILESERLILCDLII